jgi:hypothetical protein
VLAGFSATGFSISPYDSLCNTLARLPDKKKNAPAGDQPADFASAGDQGTKRAAPKRSTSSGASSDRLLSRGCPQQRLLPQEDPLPGELRCDY